MGDPVRVSRVWCRESVEASIRVSKKTVVKRVHGRRTFLIFIKMLRKNVVLLQPPLLLLVCKHPIYLFFGSFATSWSIEPEQLFSVCLLFSLSAARMRGKNALLIIRERIHQIMQMSMQHVKF